MAQTVLVTGASSGIGQATARLLAEHGFNVFGTARKPEAPLVALKSVLPWPLFAVGVRRTFAV